MTNTPKNKRFRDESSKNSKLEVVVIPVSDVDRAKSFYGGLGWRLDADFGSGDDFRVIQFTPPGSTRLGHLRPERHPGGTRLRPRAVSDRLRHRGRPRRTAQPRRRRRLRCFTTPATFTPARTSPICLDEPGSAACTPSVAATAHSRRSAIRTATAGCSRRSPCECPDA